MVYDNGYIILLNANKTPAGMSHNHITLETEFFHPAPHPELQELTNTSDTHRSDMPLLDAPLPLPLSHSPHPSPTSQTKFYEEYKRIYLIAFTLQAEKKRMQKQVEAVMSRLNSIEGKLSHQDGKNREGKQLLESARKNDQSSDDNRNKRSRRTAEEIEKKHQCHAYQCERYYGSQGSLQQHIKLKHPQLLRKSQQGDESERSIDENPISDFMPVD